MFDATSHSTFVHTITSTYGTKGSQWLEALPMIINQCISTWHLSKLKPYPALTYNYVMSGTMHSTPIVLKLRCSSIELEKEIVALEAYKGHGCVKVLAYNLNLGAMILEQVIPGTPLTSLFPRDDKKATRIAADCIKSLHQVPIPDSIPFQNLEELLPELKNTSTILDRFIARAQEQKKHLLLTTQQEKVLLHGDFHQGNILSLPHKQWTIIDPEGIIGDPVYDLAVYIRNPLPALIASHNASTIIAHRINTFATCLGYTPQRIYDGTYLQAVISAYWSIEDGLDITRHIAFLTLLENM